MLRINQVAAAVAACGTLGAAGFSGTAIAAEGAVPQGIDHLDHAFVILMENHGYQQIINNPNEPYLNSLIANKRVNSATNYFAVGHPSLTNYLEIVGGSNFGVRSDNPPAWHDATCNPNIVTGIVNADNGGNNAPVTIDTGSVCPIAGVGTDAETPAIDNWNEVTLPQFPYLADIDGIKAVPAAKNTEGKTIADQLAVTGRSWKSYQESLPQSGADGVNYSNGTASNLTNFTPLAPLTSSSVVQDYAAKHDPFVYFKSVQEGTLPNHSLKNIVGFDGPTGLYADLASGHVPTLAFIAPNQCNDQHGRGNADAFCAYDYGANSSGLTYGTQVGLNPGLIQQGDATLERLVKAIQASPAWHEGRNAIVIVWDENDYSGVSALPAAGATFPKQNQNQVVLTVQLNHHETHGVQSATYYNSFSLLKSLEAAFDLPCLNHACDPDVAVMTDLFGKGW
ncbi:MAG TPA: alkaline phosphatase family protein [Burkholderiaceae bacterium]|nr:alkaline phosphatase family protein [Burkholderiaceae bacterium]